MSDYIIECVEDAIRHLLVVPEFAEEWQRLRARLTPDRERVARAIADANGYGPAIESDDYLELADAAIAAMGEKP